MTLVSFIGFIEIMQLLIMLTLIIILLQFYQLNTKELIIEQYEVKLTNLQFWAYFNVFHNQINQKCANYVNLDKNSCIDFCRTYYSYVPGAPNKNLMAFDQVTRQCIPAVICPKQLGIKFNQANNTCQDQINGRTIPSLEALPPNIVQYEVTLTIFCQHGKVIKNKYGLYDCQCDLGWTTKYFFPVRNDDKAKFTRCNYNATIYDYIPYFKSMIYDQYRQNPFPRGQSQDYFVRAMIYYLRNLKYSIVWFFRPPQAQMLIYVLNEQNTIRNKDIIAATWITIISFLVICLSCYQNHRQKEQI